MIKHRGSKSWFCILLLMGFSLAACSGGGDSAEDVPQAVQDVDALLAKPYADHFKDFQGDFAVARNIAGKVQVVLDKADPMSLPQIVALVDEVGALEKDPSEANYASLVEEWNRVRTKIRLKKD